MDTEKSEHAHFTFTSGPSTGVIGIDR